MRSFWNQRPDSLISSHRQGARRPPGVSPGCDSIAFCPLQFCVGQGDPTGMMRLCVSLLEPYLLFSKATGSGLPNRGFRWITVLRPAVPVCALKFSSTVAKTSSMGARIRPTGGCCCLTGEGGGVGREPPTLLVSLETVLSHGGGLASRGFCILSSRPLPEGRTLRRLGSEVQLPHAGECTYEIGGLDR